MQVRKPDQMQAALILLRRHRLLDTRKLLEDLRQLLSCKSDRRGPIGTPDLHAHLPFPSVRSGPLTPGPIPLQRQGRSLCVSFCIAGQIAPRFGGSADGSVWSRSLELQHACGIQARRRCTVALSVLWMHACSGTRR